ncbi:hypothetical protein CCX46_15975 [Pseudomonas sp. RU47]|uniref:hypothetical protein n=1 Tax=Pseudomonas sp. RU47 TaxID=2005388 RepID=UPI000FDDDCBE|nr:hypothetical protein [Pseudomonas sp. RU47]AZZ76586.1 hypothetical protein CCX46_15975 [Pseudomonas sp. RU47]
MSAKDQPDNAPLILNELKIPGRTGPVSETPKVWGINRAAALDNFPRQGLLCQAGPWAPMNRLDKLVIYKDKTQEILPKTVDENEVGTELQMFVEARHITEGTYTLSYSVTRLGGTAENSLEMQVLVKLTLPGGPDHSEGPGHPELVMRIPEEILKDGVHQDNIGTGISIALGKADGSPPYPFAAAGDTPQFSWGGVFVSGPALTQEQAEGKTPVIVTIPKKTIVDAGDSGEAGLAVAFEVYDLVDNRSDGWSVEQRVVVTLDETRLGAPLLKEALNNVLDVDKLGDADGTVQVVAVNPSPPPIPPRPIDFEVGDTIFVRIKGTPKEGPPIDIELPAKVLIGVPSVPEITVSNAVLRQLAQAQIALSYRLEKADGSAPRNAKTQFISAIGEIHRLAAPVALEAKQGAIDPLDPDLKQVTIEFAFDPAFDVGQAIKLFWLGTRPDLSTYLPNLNLRPITQGDMDAQLPLQIIVDKQHLTPIIGGKLELYYQLLIDDSVLATMSKLNQTHAIRESIHADILQIGEPRKELPEPTVDGVVNGALPADTSSTTLTVNYLKTFKDDIVTRFWEGSITGVSSDWVKLSTITAGQPVPFTIKAELIKGNEGGTVKASYELKRAAGGTSYSDTLEFSVGVRVELPVATFLEATGAQRDQLNPNDVYPNGATPVIPAEALLKEDDEVIVTVEGKTTTTHPHRVSQAEADKELTSIKIPYARIEAEDGGEIVLSYTVGRNAGGTDGPSDPTVYDVRKSVDTGRLKVFGARVNRSAHRPNSNTRFLKAFDEYTGLPVAAEWKYQSDNHWTITDSWRDTSPQEPLQVRTLDDHLTLNPANIIGNGWHSNTIGAVVALRDEGNVVGWGHRDYGANIPGLIIHYKDVVEVSCTHYAYAIRLGNGLVLVWGNPAYGGDMGSINPSAFTQVVGNSVAFAALKSNGSVVSWGYQEFGGRLPKPISELTDVVQLVPGFRSFALQRSNGKLMAWGAPVAGDIPDNIANLTDVKTLLGNNGAFAALRNNGQLVAWGDASSGGHVPDDIAEMTDIVELCAHTSGAFAARRANGQAVAWGRASSGGSIDPVIGELRDIVEIISTEHLFVALRANGQILAWGSAYNSPLPPEIGKLDDIVQVCCTRYSFAALRKNGTVVKWGALGEGGDDDQLTQVRAIYSNMGSFTALTADGRVVTWGSKSSGEDSSAVQHLLRGQVSYLASPISRGLARKALGLREADGESSH